MELIASDNYTTDTTVEKTSAKDLKRKPLVSICIPAYNCEKYIEATINCLLNQTYNNIEIIVVDDGSEDNTVNVLKNFVDDRLVYEKQNNSGAAAARNKAFLISKGEYIKFLDADDLISPDTIKEQLKKIENKPDCIASSKWGRFFFDDVNTLIYNPEPVWKDLPGVDWIVESLIDTGCNMTQPGIFLMHRKKIENAGLWNESLSLIDDFEFFTRIIVNSSHVLFCADALLLYRSGINGSLSKLNSRKQLESALLAQLSGIKEILKIKNSFHSRLACANSCQVWAYYFYPEHMDLYKKIQIEIDRLGGSSISIKTGKVLKVFCFVLGWKTAKRLKFFLLKIFGRSHFKIVTK